MRVNRNSEDMMKKYLPLILLAFFMLSCGVPATPTATATLPPTPDSRYGQTFEFTPPAEWRVMDGLPNGNVWETTLMPTDWKVSDDGQLTIGQPKTPGMNEPIEITTIGNVPRELFDNVDDWTVLKISGRWWFVVDDATGLRHDYFVVEKVTIDE